MLTSHKILACIILIGGLLLLSGVLYFSFAPAGNSETAAVGATKMFTLTDPSADTHTITLTEKGFVPEELVIKQNDTVVFKTDRGEPFWPASNLHPQHSIYPDFDPKKPVSPNETWQFTFSEAGRYTYHDHVFANYRGLIIVLSPEQEATGVSAMQSADVNECAKFTEIPEKQQCWDEQLQFVLETNGIDVAFDYFLQLYETEPDIPKECHGWGHTLGEAAYDIYKDGDELNLRPETAYCGYGYFHGFLGALITDTGRVQDTREFCVYVAEQLEGQVRGVLDNCVHGVGHGTTAMLLEEGNYNGDFIAVGDEALKICELIYTDSNDLENCYDGVFNELQLELFNSGFGMDFDAYMELGDPFYYCKIQEERHKKACFYELTGMFWKIFDHDVMAMTEYALEHTEDLPSRGGKVLAKIAADQIQFDIVKPTHEKSIDACRIVPDYLFEDCFVGIVNGFIQHGEPGKLHIKGYAFCQEDHLTDSERNMCYENLTRMIEYVSTPEEFKTACEYINYDPRATLCSSLSST